MLNRETGNLGCGVEGDALGGEKGTEAGCGGAPCIREMEPVSRWGQERRPGRPGAGRWCRDTGDLMSLTSARQCKVPGRLWNRAA